jgi:very-short-patch-repair endonuclease
MRTAPTTSEALLWAALRGSRLGVGFRRQAVIGPFIVDFLAPSVRLVVEVDGAYHALRSRADERRDRFLCRAGYRVIRFSALQVSRDLPGVIQAIARTI